MTELEKNDGAERTVTLPEEEIDFLLSLLARLPFPQPGQKMLAASAQIHLSEAK